MSLLDQTRFDKLLQLAHDRFDPNLPPAEEKVLHDSASSEDLPEPDEKAPRPEIRPEFLRWLATDPDAAPHIDPKGLRVFAATIPGKLDLRECHVNPSLMFFRCDFQSEINLESAETRGICVLDSSLAGGIHAEDVIIHGSFYLQRIHSEGGIFLLGARIEGVLHCSRAKLKATGNALSADGAKIDGGVFLNDGFESEGTIRLLGAEITGNLECDGAKLKAKVDALIVDNAKIGGNVFIRGGFESEGEIRLLGAKIIGQLVCTGAKLKAQGNALILENAKIGSDVFLTDGFESEGAIRLHGAEITGDLLITCAKVAGVRCQNMVVKGDLAWQRINKSNDIYLNLTGARVKNLRDEQASWPNEGNLDLDGLVYEELTLHEDSHEDDFRTNQYTDGLPFNVEERIKWLKLQPPDRRTEPQPWMQLRDLLERKGDHKGAKYVLFRFRCLQAQNRWWLRRWWNYYFAWLEEEFLRIRYSIAVFLLAGSLIFGYAGAKGAIAPTGAKAYTAFTAGTPMPAAYPTLNPFVYTLENAVPLVKLGMDEKWAPDRRYPGTDWLTNYWFLMWSRWLLILSGWLQATVLVAALSERFKK
jgi:cytoskeletal protein CcmA (bactofilin family)